MFQAIEHARMLVGTKAMATVSTGYLNALDYAKTCVQGPDLTRSTDKTAPRVTIAHHPDVRRSLLTQKSYAEALRALVIYAATLYEGTTGIQGIDLFFRKIVKNNGRAIDAVAAEIRALLASDAGNGRLKVERELLATGLADKVAVVQFFARNVLPKVTAELAVAQATDLLVMDLVEAGF